MSDDALQRTLAALREQYLAESPERIRALQVVLERVRGGEHSALDELRHLLHKLAGSGGAYGLHAVTDTARAGELAAHALAIRGTPPTAEEVRSLGEHVAGVQSAFREAGAKL